MTTILFIWTIVGGNSNFHGADYDWRPMGNFSNPSTCHDAARNLNKKPLQYRCINTLGAMK